MGWKIEIGTAATHKYAVSKSGDVVEVVERPDGGIGVVLADGQGSGSPARAIARMVATQAADRLRDGVRAEAAAIAASDLLFHARGGQVSAGLDLMTIGPAGGIEIARFSSNLIVVGCRDGWRVLDRPGEPAGRAGDHLPVIEAIALQPGLRVILATDGIAGAGERFGASFALPDMLPAIENEPDSATLASWLLERAMEADRGRPQDDMTIVVVTVDEANGDQRIRHSSVSAVWR